MLEWNDFPVILAIARTKSLYKAAQSLDVSVSTVMRRMEQFETRATVPLFRKMEAGYVPTPAGQALILKAREMERLAAAADKALQSEISKTKKKMRISASEVIGPYFVARHLPALKEACPDHDIILTVTTQSPSQTADEFDISLWPSTPSNEDLFGRKLTDVKWAYFGRDKSGNSPENLSDLHPSLVDLFGRRGAEKINPPAPVSRAKADRSLATNSLIAAAALATSGAATAHLPFILGANWPGLRPLTLPDVHEIGELWAIYRKHDVQSPQIRGVVDALAAAARVDAALFLGAEHH